MYSGSLASFYKDNPDIKKLSYDDHYRILSETTTEFVGSYTRGFNKLGFDARFVVSNDGELQTKWVSEHKKESDGKKDILSDQVKHFQPEILWIDNLNLVDNKWLENIRENVKSIRLIVGYHCSPYNQRIIDTLRVVDLVFTCTPGIKADMEKNGLKSFLVYHAFDDTLIPGISEISNHADNGFVFSGSLISGARFHDERIKMIENILRENIEISLYVNLEKQYRIRIKQSIFILRNLLKKLNLETLTEKMPLFEYGRTKTNNYSDILLKSCNEPVYGLEMYKLFRNSSIVLNMHIGVAGEFAGNMRMFEVTGMGSCLLTDKKKNLGELFDVDNEIVAYDNTEDCISKAKWLMGHENERKQIAEAGHQRTLKSHTVENRCMIMKAILEEELKQR
jgi:spore maturation protein CgeB